MPEEPPNTGEPSVLGNLPHSRPGRRSEKRDAAARPARRASGARRRARAAEPKPAGAVREEPPAAPAHGPVGAAVHFATKVAGTGVRVTWAVARELLRRLPRP
jgi:hypothetical protein